MTESYEYYKGKTTNQYGTLDSGREIVDAVYRRTAIEADQGNPMIEALPLVRTNKEMAAAYSVSIPAFYTTDFSRMSRTDCVDSISLLKSARLQLPYHDAVEMELHRILVLSYRHRSVKLFMRAGSFERNTPMLISDCRDTKDVSARILGGPGTGKTACIDIAVKRYPKAIRHTIDGCTFLQIPILCVTCPPNSNFKALFRSIAREVDRTLGYADPVHEEYFMDNKKSVDDMAMKVIDLIEAFAIGALVLDEIQLLNLAGQTSGSDNALLKIINMTGVGLVCVGTKDALDRLNGELHLARRLGMLIDTDRYTESREFFTIVMSWLVQYQWTAKKARLTKAMTDAMYEQTGGIIDMVISIWTCAQLELVKSGSEKAVTPELIAQIAERYYPGFRDVIAGLESDNTLRRMQYENMRASAEEKRMLLESEIKDEEKAQQLIQSFDAKEMQAFAAKKEHAVEQLRATFEVTGMRIGRADIEAEVTCIMTTDEYAEASAKQIAKAAYENLLAARTASAPAAKPKKKRAKAGSKSDLMTVASLRESEESCGETSTV